MFSCYKYALTFQTCPYFPNQWYQFLKMSSFSQKYPHIRIMSSLDKTVPYFQKIKIFWNIKMLLGSEDILCWCSKAVWRRRLIATYWSQYSANEGPQQVQCINLYVTVCGCITDVCVGSGSQQQFHTVTLVVQTAVVQRCVPCRGLRVDVGAKKKWKN